MARSKKLTDRELVAICEAEMASALGVQGKELAAQRSKAIDYYLGEMDDHLPVEEDRSTVVSRDVADTVEWILPSLMRIFVDSDNMVVFSPVGPEDEQLAEQETDIVKHVFMEENDGFLNLYTFCKDALLQKTGLFKCWYEDPTWEREEYVGLTPEQYLMLLMEPGCQYEILEQTDRLDDLTGQPVIDLTIKVARKAGKVRVGCLPPEEFGISSSASSPNPKDATFQFHRRRMTAAELLEEGHSRKLVESLPFEDGIESEEGLAKSAISGEEDYSSEVHWSMRSVWVSECYLKIDKDNDGVAETLCVKLAGPRTGTGNSKLLSVDEVDKAYISAATPVIMTHKFYGQSIADLVMDIQEIRTTLLRGMLDSMYLANNGRTAVNEKVNLDDLLVSRPGGIVRVQGEEPPHNSLMAMQQQGLPPETFGLLEVLDKVLKQRSGVGDEVMGLDSDALANINTGVIAQAYDSARMRIEMIARIIAEIGIKSVFKDLHELLRKHQDIPMAVKLRNEWITVNPSEWRERTNVRVQVGIGNHTKERKQLALRDIEQKQVLVIQGGGLGTLVSEQNIYNLLSDTADIHSLEPSRYFTDPSTVPPKQPQPSPDQIKAQIEMAKLEMDKQRLALETRKSELEAQVKMAQAEMSYRKMEVDEQSQIMNANSSAANTAWQAQLKEMQLMLDKYKAELASATSLESKMMEIEQRSSEQFSNLMTELLNFRAGIEQDFMDRSERANEQARESAQPDTGN